jgi:hypothetical protein
LPRSQASPSPVRHASQLLVKSGQQLRGNAAHFGRRRTGLQANQRVLWQWVFFGHSKILGTSRLNVQNSWRDAVPGP